MRISIIVQGRFHAFDLAREFHKLGHLHQLITPYPKYVAERFGVPRDKVTSLLGFELFRRAESRLPLGQHLHGEIEVRWIEMYAEAAARVLKECDVLLAWSSVGAPAFRKARAWRTLCICERGSAHILTQERLLREEHELLGLPWVEWTDRKRSLELRDYETADQIEVLSKFARASFIEEGVEQHRLINEPLGVNVGQFIHKELATHREFRILYAGNLSLQKGIHYLLRAFIEANLKDSQLWFIGSRTPETSSLIPDGQPSSVKLLGHVSQFQLPDLYYQGAVFVLPSIQDGFGVVILQALASGLPVICTTNTGGPDVLAMSGVEPEEIEEGIWKYPAGFIVPIRRPDCIAYCLRLLYEDRELLRQMRAEAVRLAEKSLDWSHVAARMIERYETLVPQRKHSSSDLYFTP